MYRFADPSHPKKPESNSSKIINKISKIHQETLEEKEVQNSQREKLLDILMKSENCGTHKNERVKRYSYSSSDSE